MRRPTARKGAVIATAAMAIASLGLVSGPAFADEGPNTKKCVSSKEFQQVTKGMTRSTMKKVIQYQKIDSYGDDGGIGYRSCLKPVPGSMQGSYVLAVFYFKDGNVKSKKIDHVFSDVGLPTG